MFFITVIFFVMALSSNAAPADVAAAIAADGQRDLFTQTSSNSPPINPIVERIQSIDANNYSPLAALELLYELVSVANSTKD